MPTNCPGCRRPIAGEADRKRPHDYSANGECWCRAFCNWGNCAPPGGWPARVAELEKEVTAWKHCLVDYAVPLEAIALVHWDQLGPDVRDGIERARASFMALSPAGEGGGGRG